MEDVLGNSSFSDYIANSFSLQSIFDLSEGERIPLGFMELLGVQDLSPPLFDTVQQVPSIVTQPLNPSSTKIESPEVFNQPATPNSSSISSASSEALIDEPVKVDDQEEDQQKTKKQ